MPLTKEQEKAVLSEEKVLLVPASAGSGKTKVLITRIIHLVMDKKIEVSSMLVCTFTKLASQEMKSRLKTELEKVANQDEFYQKQLNELSVSNISTIHKFCQNVIKEYFYEIQIDPNFSIVEDEQAKLLKNRALEKVLSEYEKSQDEEFSNVFEIFYESRHMDTLKQSINEIYNYLLSKNSDFFAQTLKNSYNEDLKNNIAVKYFEKELQKVLDYYEQIFTDLLNEARKCCGDKLITQIEKVLDFVNNLQKCSFENLYSVYSGTKLDKATKSSNSIVEELEVYEKYKSRKAEFLDRIKDLKGCFAFNGMENLKVDFSVSKKILNKIYEVVDKFKQEYQTIKRKQNVLDFNDLEQYCLKILQNDSIRMQIQNKFSYIFVDEYQDTNEIQEEIIKYLTKDNYIFMVGDVKQSIYGFRNSNPKIFLNKLKMLNKDENAVISLNKNFRSDKNILDFCNMVFDNIMTEETSELDYKNTSSLIYGENVKQSKNAESGGANIEVLLIDGESDEEKGQFDLEDDSQQDERLKTENESKENEDEIEEIYSVKNAKINKPKFSSLEKEALMMVSKIKKILDNQIYDDEIKAYRNIEYKDIAILTRTKNAIKVISEVLSQYSIPITSEYQVDLFQTSEIKLLFDYLKLLDNPFDDIALTSVLKSCMCNLSNEELIIIKQSKDTEYFYQAVFDFDKNINNINHNDNFDAQKLEQKIDVYGNSVANENGVNKDIGEINSQNLISVYSDEQNKIIVQKINKLKTSLNIFRDKLASLNLCNLVEEIIDYFDLKNYYFDKPNYNEIMENIVFFTESLKSLESNSLCSLIDYFENTSSQINADIKIQKNLNSVFIGTIHSSKGLEYPVVFIADSSHRFSKTSIQKNIVKNDTLGFGINVYSNENKTKKSSIIKKIISHKIVNQEKQEEMRLLYVALTRAKNYLYIVGTKKLEKVEAKKSAVQIDNITNYLDYILSSMSEENIEKIKAKNSMIFNEFPNYKIEIFENTNLEQEDVQSNCKFNQEFAEKLKEYINKKFESNSYVFKNTVTALLQNQTNEQTQENHYNIKDFKYNINNTQNDEDFLLIGTNYHKVMELVNFENFDVDEHFESMEKAFVLSKSELSQINKDKVKKAVELISALIEKNDVILREKTFVYYPNLKNINSSHLNFNVLVQGMVDLAIVKEDGIILIDYKTTKSSSEKYLKDKYALQLNLYAQALEEFYQKKVVKKYIYSFSLDKLIIVWQTQNINIIIETYLMRIFLIRIILWEFF